MYFIKKEAEGDTENSTHSYLWLMIDEGYIKFEIHWNKTPPLEFPQLETLIYWRQQCFLHNLIGAYPNRIGFGNISVRKGKSNQFYISGSATGNEKILSKQHFALVTKVDVASNQLWCEGAIVASSESMSHAIIYEKLPWVNAVIHAHDLAMWQRLLHQVPTTAADAPYGSPEMVASIAELIDTTNLAEQKIFVMEGHEEGIFVFGTDVEKAFNVCMNFS